MRKKLFSVLICVMILLSYTNVYAEEDFEPLESPISILEVLKDNLFSKKINKILDESLMETVYVSTEVFGTTDGGSLLLDISPKELQNSGINNNDLVLVTINNSKYILPVEMKKDFDTNWGRTFIAPTNDKKYLKIIRKHQNFSYMEGFEDRNIGDPVKIILLQANGYKMKRSKIDKENLVQEANFRNTVIGKMDTEVIYRGHSPVDPKYKSVMCKSAAKLTRENNIATMINMNQDLEEVEKDVLFSDSSSPYYKELLNNDSVSVVQLNGEKSFSKNFKTGMKKHIKFMLNHESPYYIHCRMGKDRTGFLVALLGALDGATYQEIGEDYAESFRNYFGAEQGTWMDYYNITDGTNTFLSMMKPGVGSNEFVSNPKLIKEAAEEYMFSLGFDETDIDILKGKLNDKYYDVDTIDEDDEDDEDDY